jgi:Alpha/beta hydrolase
MTEPLGANTETLDRIAESLSADARRMLDIRDRAQRAVAHLMDGWNGPDLWHVTQQWEQQGSPQLASASTSLDSCAAELRAQATAQQATSARDGDGGGKGSLPMWVAPSTTLGIPLLPSLGGSTPPGSPDPTAMPGFPPNHGSPADNASWWRALSPQQQEHVTNERPDWVGNRDGLPFTARDEANRALLSVSRARLLDQRRRLEADLADHGFGDALTDDEALEQVKDKVAALDAIVQTLARGGDRQLLVLDMSAERAQAAIARGNVDTADNVAVFVPGLSTTVNNDGQGGDLQACDERMEELQRRTELESKRAGANLSAATVTWIGYQAPQKGWNLLGDSSVANDRAATIGAAQLVPFLRGIDAARDRDAHLSLLGHSYGSTTAGLALRQDTGVDDVVFFGSPGIGTNHVDDLLVPRGHTYYIEARRDAVGDLGYFGIDPSHLDGIEHASARKSTVVDPVSGQTRHFTEVTGHRSYLDDGSTSQYNLSVIVAGLPERRVFDRGRGLGDVLSWPVPGTYS